MVGFAVELQWNPSVMMKPISTSTYTFSEMMKRMAAIRERRYYERYLGSGDKVVLVGAGFSLKTRNLTRPKIETT